MKEKILVIEDEVKISRVISLELEYGGYEVNCAETGRIGLEKALRESWDLILLDVMLPELSGIEVLRRIRTTDSHTPIILLTARDTIPDKVMGLDQGANDYITKPFEIEELLARIRASIRSSQLQKDESNESTEEEALSVDDLTVHIETRIITRSGREISLTPREFDLLVYLMKHKNQVVNREKIILNVWGDNFFGETSVVDVYIRYLRKKIDEGFSYPLIHTIRGVGYSIKERQV
ncbi:response regulator transcription factor [Aneurinibacillus tyrosinisolvens]|uniref:response regulator transcription factor n=1 Tax=Aneurinibacillus tyrosinisolvens TaxID=1443435 RepID=UPI00063F69D4|nr:response regulator transcription factor [Aneurinibacillus tyrosinisolvens]